MGVVLNIVRQSVVDDVCQVVYVQSTGCNVSSHQQLYGMLAELLHGQVALLLREVAVQCFGVIAVANQFVSHFLGFYLGTAKDDGEDAWIVVHQSLQCQVFVLGIYHIVDVVDVLGTLVARAHHNLLVVAQITFGYALYLAAHGGREEQCVVFLGDALQDGINTLRETHVQHFVRLVQNDIVHIVQLGHTAFH